MTSGSEYSIVLPIVTVSSNGIPVVVPGGGALGSSLACSQADFVTADDGLGLGLGASEAPRYASGVGLS